MVRKVIDSLKYLKLEDVVAPFKFLIVAPIALLYGLWIRVRGRSLWVIAEGRNDARDNGFSLFRYIRIYHPEVTIYYAINKKSPSYRVVSRYGNAIQYSGLKHWIYYIAATKNIIIHKAANPNAPLFYVLHRLRILDGNRIFLQHGVTMNNVDYLHFSETNFKLFVCGAAPEYEYIKQNFGYPAERVAYLGFPRFDDLENGTGRINPKQIVIMPTWRSWLGREINQLGRSHSVKDSEYYRRYQALINNKELIKYVEQNKMTVYFYQHANMERFGSLFSSKSDAIKIVDSSNASIQDLIIESSVMITDYSSVSIDFAFMKKSVLYYQFDKDKFRGDHLKEGYFSYEKDGFGRVIESEDELVREIIRTSNTAPADRYLKRSDNFFQIRDNKNSSRIFQKIQKLELSKWSKVE